MELVGYGASRFEVEELDDSHDTIEALRWCCAKLLHELEQAETKHGK